MYIFSVCNTSILLWCTLTLSVLAKVKKAEWQAQYEDYILENFDFNEPRITAGAQRWQDARLSRRQAVQGTTNYVQTVTSSFVGTDGYTTVPYATNGQQCSSISRNMNVVYSPNGIQYLYICGGAVSGNINWSYQAPGWSSCMPQCDTSNNCTGLSYNSGGLYGMQNAAGSGRCTYKTDNNGMTFTTTNTNQLDSTRVAGMQKDVYMRTFFPTTTTTTTTTTTYPGGCIATPPLTSITFSVLTTTTYGQIIKLAGSISQLGSWSTANALTLSASNYTTDNPVWYITVSIPAGTYFEYKYLRQESNGALTWEDGSNRVYTVPGNCVGAVTINDYAFGYAVTTTTTSTTITTTYTYDQNGVYSFWPTLPAPACSPGFC